MGERGLKIEEIGQDIVDSAIKVHQELGPGLLESPIRHVWRMNE
jgi:hypothetical protein